MNEREWLESELEIARRRSAEFDWLAGHMRLLCSKLEAELIKLKQKELKEKVNVID